ncbi:MAG TPA: 3-phosphoshikimate 1-carboxyvinyltransferase [Cerasibacillus sp.]|uniref:3-phosphoshikimate 1-carboxyvinyltransferase n=1 Tax=Cerasibacillus sp. TaxID=2498711 RepID=UPI002F3F8767
MKPIKLDFNAHALRGSLDVPGDKSITHRAIMLGSLANGTTTVSNFLPSEDCLCTLEIFQQLGVPIERDGEMVTIEGKGASGLEEPLKPLYFGNSGTTARLMLGLLAGLPLFTTVYGDQSLSKRPMDRVIQPLQQMGASIYGRDHHKRLPLAIIGKPLSGMTHKMPIKSAQVKSAMLLAGLHADGQTTVIEQTPTRNHTELMLRSFGISLETENNHITIKGKQQLKATKVNVPGDFSSAAFFLAGALLLQGSQLVIKNIGLNPTRTGMLDVLEQMGACIHVTEKNETGGEPVGDLVIESGTLQGTTIGGNLIPRLIDELPIISLLATQAEGKTIIKDAKELRVKETDRIKAVVDVLTTLGATIEETNDGMIIYGKKALTGGYVSAYGDHRMAMMIVIASLITKQPVHIDNLSCINISYPNFIHDLKQIVI